jgi:hypothetical protein
LRYPKAETEKEKWKNLWGVSGGTKLNLMELHTKEERGKGHKPKV